MQRLNRFHTTALHIIMLPYVQRVIKYWRGFATVQASRAPFGCALLGRPMSLLQIDELRCRANAAAAVLSSARVLGDAQWINVSVDQSRRLVSLIDAVKPSGPLLVDVIQAITIANFTDTDRRGLMESLSSSALAPKPTKWHPQSFADFPSFMTKDVWDVVMDPDHDINVKSRALLLHLGRLGLKQVHEPTFATAAALLMIAQDGVTKARSTSPHYGNDMYMHLKTLWKRLSPTRPLEEIRELPGTAVDFRSQHPTTYRAVFGDDLPAVPRISLIDIKSIAGNVSQRPRRGHQKDTVGQFCQQIMYRLGMQQEQLADGSTLTFSPPGGRSRSMSSMIGAAAGSSFFGAHRSPQLALGDYGGEFGGGGGRGLPRPGADGVDGASGDRVAEPHPEVVAGASGGGLVAHAPPVLPEKN